MATWYVQTSGTTQQLNYVYGLDPFNVFAVGNNGTILFWNGNKWIKQNSSSFQNLNKIWAYSSSSIWIAGTGGALLNSINLGQTWNVINTLNTTIMANGNYVGIWGSSDLDFWVLDQVSASVYHTTNGGVSWTTAFTATGAAQWSHMWGATSNYIIASASLTVATGASKFAVYNGIGWTAITEGTARGDGIGCFPIGYTGQNFTVGQNATAGVIADWNRTFSAGGGVDAVPTGAAGFKTVYGSDLTNLYSAGVDINGNYLLAQVVPPASTPGVTGSWAGVTMPTLPTGQTGGFYGVFASPSGYATAVGADGVIVARQGASLIMTSALVISTNTVLVTFSTAPLAQSNIFAGDALNPASWTISRVDTGALFNVMTVNQVSATSFKVLIYERFASYLVQHSVSAPTLVDPFGVTIGLANSATFYGILADVNQNQAAQAAANRYTLSDIANPPFPVTDNNSGGGSRIITASGDFKTESGNALLKKLIARRLMTTPGEFFHLPEYGIGIRLKEPLKSSDLRALKKTIEDQISLEPEVSTVNASLLQDQATGILTATIRVTTVIGDGITIDHRIGG